MASSKWSTEMDRRIAEMRRDPVQYLDEARRDARRGNALMASLSPRRSQRPTKSARRSK